MKSESCKITSIFHKSDSNIKNTYTDLTDWPNRKGNGAARFSKVTTKNSKGVETNQFSIGDSLHVEIAIQTFEKIDAMRIAIGVRDSTGLPIFLAVDIISS